MGWCLTLRRKALKGWKLRSKEMAGELGWAEE